MSAAQLSRFQGCTEISIDDSGNLRILHTPEAMFESLKGTLNFSSHLSVQPDCIDEYRFFLSSKGSKVVYLVSVISMLKS